MAKRIRYLIRPMSIIQGDADAKVPGLIGTWTEENAFPADPDSIALVKMDGLNMTEQDSDFPEGEAPIRWRLLAGDREMPEGIEVKTAVILAEAIWLDALFVEEPCEFDDVFFRAALAAEAGYDSDGIEASAEEHSGWDALSENAYERGVDLRIDAWLSGVPIDVVLTG